MTVLDGRSAGRPRRRPPGRTADGRAPQAEPEGRQGRNRLANPDAAKPAGEGQAPAAAAEERGPDGRRLSAKQRLSKRGKPGEELPKTDTAKPDAPMGEAAKGEVPKDEKPSTAKDEGSKPEAKPDEEKSESAKLDSPKGEGAKSDVPLRADPVPAVTPAPKSPEGEAKPAEPAPAAGGSSERRPGVHVCIQCHLRAAGWRTGASGTAVACGRIPAAAPPVAPGRTSSAADLAVTC